MEVSGKDLDGRIVSINLTYNSGKWPKNDAHQTKLCILGAKEIRVHKHIS